jgi:hypothetical protein
VFTVTRMLPYHQKSRSDCVLLPMVLCSGCSCVGSGEEGGEMCSLLRGCCRIIRRADRTACCCLWCYVLVVAVLVPASWVARCVHCYEDVAVSSEEQIGLRVAACGVVFWL